MAQTDALYKELLEQCKSYNSRLMVERKARLPFLDSQTRVAQNDCALWFEQRHRGPGLKPNQVYSYPSKRWKKRPRFLPLIDPQFESVPKSGYNTRSRRPVKVPSYNEDFLDVALLNENSNDSNSLSTLAVSMIDTDGDALDTSSLAGGSVQMDNDDDEDFDEEYESRSKKRSKKSGKTMGSRSKKNEGDEKDKPHSCMYCNKRYRNRQALRYHLQHVHPDEIDADDEYTPGGRSTPSPSMIDETSSVTIASVSTSSRQSAVAAQKAVAAAVADITSNENEKNDDTLEVVILDGARRQQRRTTHPNDYCDFCLGDAGENKKTGESEELVSCADCGRSGHPSCLQFTDVMTMNVKKYSWQCIECKSCHVCGTSDNDEQLLFCDDCDRGYHMYCLMPPMNHPPEGSWICSLCEADQKERLRMQNAVSTDGSKTTLNL